MEINVDVCMWWFREQMKELEEQIRRIKSILQNKEDNSVFFSPDADVWECFAQLTIALRDLESSRMRLGKVIQYNATDKTSIYDQKQ